MCQLASSWIFPGFFFFFFHENHTLLKRIWKMQYLTSFFCCMVIVFHLLNKCFFFLFLILMHKEILFYGLLIASLNVSEYLLSFWIIWFCTLMFAFCMCLFFPVPFTWPTFSTVSFIYVLFFCDSLDLFDIFDRIFQHSF